MNSFYAFILLCSFLVGIIQPVLPMVEYYLFKDYIAANLCEERTIEVSDCEGMCYLKNQIRDQEETRNEMPATMGEYYPGTILCEGVRDITLYPADLQLFAGHIQLVPDQPGIVEVPPPESH